MNDDDLYGPKLTPAPQTSPLVRGAAVAMVTVSLAVTGCNNSNPGLPNPGVADAGISIAPDMGAAPGLVAQPDAGHDAHVSPGVDATPGVDAGHDVDSGNPGDST